MIYEEPRFRPAGDRYVLVELGNEMNLELNFKAQGLATAVKADGIRGVIETAPCFASLLIHYDPEQISFDDVERQITRLASDIGPIDQLQLDSRLFILPAMYCDPWTKASYDEYVSKVAPKAYDPQQVAEANGLADLKALGRTHSATEYWVAALGFWPGLPFMMALDPRCMLTAPKYNPPRTSTPQGTLGLGGASNSIYPVNTPGGYQMLGRTPTPIWHTEGRYSVFGDSACLFRPGDRVRFTPIGLEEFEATEAAVNEGRYVYNVIEYQRFSVKNYREWLSSLDRDERF